MFHADYSDCSMVSDKWHIMRDLGFPQLDIKRWDDGEWAVLEYQNAPLVPSLTKWKYVLTKIRNTEITESFLRRYLWQIDPRTKAFWEKDERERVEQEKARQYYENEKAERIMALGKELAKNDDLMDKAYRMGPAAFDLENIGRKIHAERPWKLKDL